jgi:hypothetical protein
MVIKKCHATGETLLIPDRNGRKKVSSITHAGKELKMRGSRRGE